MRDGVACRIGRQMDTVAARLAEAGDRVLENRRSIRQHVVGVDVNLVVAVAAGDGIAPAKDEDRIVSRTAVEQSGFAEKSKRVIAGTTDDGVVTAKYRKKI